MNLMENNLPEYLPSVTEPCSVVFFVEEYSSDGI